MEAAREPVRPTDQLGSAALATAAVGAGWVGVQGVIPVGLPCPLLTTTGVPCPFCGLTRLGEALLHGDVFGALATDPGGVVLVLLVALLAIAAVARRASLLRTPVRIGARTVVLALGLALVGHWATTLAGGGYVV